MIRNMTEFVTSVIKKRLGGEGSGFFGHAGRPGEVGGSSSEGGTDIPGQVFDKLKGSDTTKQIVSKLDALDKQHDHLLEDKSRPWEDRKKEISTVLKQKKELAKQIYPVKIELRADRDILGRSTGKVQGVINFRNPYNDWYDEQVFNKTVAGRNAFNDTGKKIGAYFGESLGSANIGFNPSEENIKIAKQALESQGYKVEVLK